jgi:hypothetical protein
MLLGSGFSIEDVAVRAITVMAVELGRELCGKLGDGMRRAA